MEEFKKLLLGNVSAAYYIAAEFFALMAILLSLYVSSKKRDVKNPSTPEKFSWYFLIWDNLKRILAGQIALFILFRFATEFIGRELNMFWALGIGFFVAFGLDQVLAFIKSKISITGLDMPRKEMLSNLGVTPENMPKPDITKP